MNKIYKTIWSKTRKTFVVVSETAKFHSSEKSKAFSISVFLASFCVVLSPVITVAADVNVDEARRLPIGATSPTDTLVNTSNSVSNATALVIGVNEKAQQIVPTADTQTNVLDSDLGFMNVTGVTNGLFINNGKQFILVGRSVDDSNPDQIELADGVVWVGSYDLNDNQSKLTLGSSNSLTKTKGHLKELNVGINPSSPNQGGAGGIVVVRNGEFWVDTLKNGTTGQDANYNGIEIGSETDRETTLNVLTYESYDCGSLVNYGNFNVDSITSVNSGNRIDNRNVLTAKSANFTGVMTNSGNARIGSLTLNSSGNLNNINSTLTVDNFYLEGDSRDGHYRGGLKNLGTLTISLRGGTAGDFENAQGGTVSVKDDFYLTANGTLVNRGGMEVSFLTAVSTNEAAKFINTGKFTLLSDKGNSSLGFNIENSSGGFFTIKGPKGSQASTTFTAGTFTNEGTFSSESELLYLGTGATFKNSGTAHLNSIYINGEGLFENTNKGHFADTGTVQLDMSSGTHVGLSNAGTIELNNLKLNTGKLSNGGTLSVTNAEIKSSGFLEGGVFISEYLKNQGFVSGITLKVANGSSSGNLKVNDTFLVEQDGQFTNEENGTIEASNGITIKGELINKGGLFSEGTSSVVENTGKFTAQSDTKFNNLTLKQGATLKVEKGEVIVTYLTAEGAIYTQTEGTFKAENGWFSNSILNIQGGVLDVTKSNKEGILGNNTVNISGNNVTPSIDNKAHPDDKIKYKDGLTQVVIGTLTSDSIVNIKAGGLLDVESINLTENKKTLTLDGGVIQTSADQIFYQTKKEVLPLDDKEPVQSVELPGNLVTSSVGAVKDSVKAGLTLKSGNLVLDDKTFSTSLVSEVTESLTSAFGSATKLTVNFLGVASTTIFNLEEAEKLASNLQTNVVLNGVTLYNEKNENKDPDWLNVGQTSPDLNPGRLLEASMGFKNIALATGVTIADDRELALVGNIAGTLSDSDFSSNLNKLLTSPDNGGTIFVKNGTLTLGTNGAAESSVGWIGSSDVSQGSNIKVKNGQFAIWNLNNEEGNVFIASNAALRVNNLRGEGTTINQGQFLLKDYIGDKAKFELNGVFTNSGADSVLDASSVENSVVKNKLTNEGTTLFKNLTVSGTLINDGTEQGESLTINGSYEGSGSSVWNSVSVEEMGTVEISGNFTVTEDLAVEGELENAGTLSYKDAIVVKNATMTNSGIESGESLMLAAGAERINEGSSSLQKIQVDKGAIYENKGTESGQNMTLNEGSIYSSTGQAQWKLVTIKNADFNSSGAFATENFALSAGAVSLTGGEFKTANAVLDGGIITVGDALGVASASAEMGSSAIIKSMISVLNGSELGFGVGALAYAETLNAPKGPANLAMTQKVILAEGSGLTVGENTHPAAQEASGTTSLVFGDGTTTLVDCSLLKDGTGVFSSNGQAASLTVAPTATLILGNIEEAGDYTVVSGFDTADNVSGSGWTGGWTGDKLYALAQDGTGINWELELHNDASRVWVTAILNDVLSMYPDIAVPNIANDELRHAQKEAFTYGVLRNKDLSAAEKTAIVNSAANISFAGSALSVGFNDLTTALDSVENRVSMKGESFTEEGLMRDWPHGNNLWIDLTGGKQKYKRFGATGIGEAGYKTDAFGFTLGFDRKVTPASILGAAFSYNRGSLDSTGDVSKTKNKYNSYGIHAYGAYSPSSRLNVVGTLTYLRGSSDITQYINAAGFGNADADVKTNLLAAGIRVETTLKARSSSVVPHAGIRYVYAKSEKYDTKVDGKKIWSNKTKANNAVQFPIGVALRGDIATGNGWNIRPQADFTFIPQAGSTNQRTTLTDVNGISDRISGEFAGNFGTNVNLGVQADKGGATLGFLYGFTGGSKGKADQTFRLEARWRF